MSITPHHSIIYLEVKLRIVLLLDINNSVIESLLKVLFSSHESISLKKLSFYEHNKEENELYLITNDNKTLELYKEDNEFKKIFFIGECEPSKLVQPLPAKSCTNLLLNYFKDIESVKNNNQPSYYSIPISLLLEAHKIEFDLYLKITKKDEGPEYIKRFESSDSLDMIALHRYLEKGEDQLYFKFSDKEKV